MSVRIHHLFYSEPSPESATLFQATGTLLNSIYTQFGTEKSCEGATSVFLHIFWTKGDETSIEVQARYANTSGGSRVKPTIITSSGATSAISDVEFQMTDSDSYSIPFGVEGRFVSFFIKATGGTPTGTFGAGIVVKRE